MHVISFLLLRFVEEVPNLMSGINLRQNLLKNTSEKRIRLCTSKMENMHAVFPH
jgi:hypothetical protein